MASSSRSRSTTIVARCTCTSPADLRSPAAAQALGSAADSSISGSTLTRNARRMGSWSVRLSTRAAASTTPGPFGAYQTSPSPGTRRRRKSTALAAIESRTANLRQRLDCGPWTDAKLTQLIETYSPDAIARYRSVCLALDSVTPLHDDWASLVGGSTETMRVAQDIADHDNLGKDALQLATAG